MSKMKYSGVEWIGEIPMEWNINKLKNCAKEISSGGTPDSSNIEYYDNINGIPWVAIGDMSNNNIVNDTAKKITKIGLRSKKLNIYPKETLLYSIFATIGKTSLLNIDATINQAILAIIPNNLINKIYLKYQLNAMEEYVIADCSTNTQSNLNSAKVKNFIIVLPKITEQKLISNFLDKKVSELEEILNDLNRQLNILNKYRDSLIYKYTTFGLHNCNYLNTKNKWYSKIPINWKLMPLKYLTSILTCGVASTPDYVDENEGVLFISAQNIQNHKLDLSIRKYIPKSLHNMLVKNRKPQKGDILQVRVGATIGKSAIIDIDDEFSIYVSLTHIRTNHNMINKYMNYIISTDMFRKMASLDVDYAGTQGNLNVSDLKEIRIPVPPINEQKEIVEYLDKKCKQIDKIIEDKQKQIQNIEEYKKSVIYEYVTGKKRVKGAEELYG